MFSNRHRFVYLKKLLIYLCVKGLTFRDVSFKFKLFIKHNHRSILFSLPPQSFSSHIMQNLKTVVEKHGFLGLYRGLSINYIRAIPTAAISFTVFEKTREFLNDTFPPAPSTKS